MELWAGLALQPCTLSCRVAGSCCWDTAGKAPFYFLFFKKLKFVCLKLSRVVWVGGTLKISQFQPFFSGITLKPCSDPQENIPCSC